MLSFRRAVFWLAVAGLASAQTVSFEGQPAIVISNGRVTITVLQQGATLASITLPADPGALNPLWNPTRLARENGRPAEFNGAFGHFVCVDGFDRHLLRKERPDCPNMEKRTCYISQSIVTMPPGRLK